MLFHYLDRLLGVIRSYRLHLLNGFNYRGHLCYVGPYSIIRNFQGNILVGRKFYCRDSLRVIMHKGILEIGDNCFVNSNVSFNCQEKITIGNDCLFGENIKLYDHDHDIRSYATIKGSGFISSPIHIGNNVWIGSNVVILKGVTIGDGAVIGAGSLVNKNIPDNHLFLNKRLSTTSEIVKI